MCVILSLFTEILRCFLTRLLLVDFNFIRLACEPPTSLVILKSEFEYAIEQSVSSRSHDICWRLIWCVNTEIFSFITKAILMSAIELRRKKWKRWKFVGNSALSWRHTRFCDAARPETLAGNNLLAVCDAVPLSSQWEHVLLN